ncbi:protein SSUH2 homolog isoform X2 [Rhinatrema bivittatum]|uniref:protein SSUH2 homolog isoform X2 n=1 Tax=Rhinatrema bivittatum TaxID=194408 RepID=UPI001128E342|nr:protein SSUH2 homolog isoform X2 [Rhinatrema bivittatum]
MGLQDAAAPGYGTMADPGPIVGNPGAPGPYPVIGMGGATAPPSNLMDNVYGYEGASTGDGEGKVLPPPANLFPGSGDDPPPFNKDWNIPFISEDLAKEAFNKYVSSKCCYSSKPVKEMVFRDLKPFNTYRYRLETFTESRSSEWASVPYTGEFVDSSAFGSAPLPWDIQVEVPTLFKDSETKVKVPHTSSVKPCSRCLALGKIQCTKCNGTGRERCWVCNGRGMRTSDTRCTVCNGIGNVCCSSCHGSGRRNCDQCGAKGQLLCYIQLTIKWKNNEFVFVADQRSGFPMDLFKKVKGKTLFTDEQYLVHPLVTFPDPAINQASQNALQQHCTQFASTARILRQRQTVEQIPLTKVDYEWSGRQYTYFVYGEENSVYTEDYPAKCCCSVM